MTNPSKLSNLTDAEKSIKDKQHGPYQEDTAKSKNDKDSKEQKSAMRDEGGKN